MKYDFAAIEKKWQDRWEESKPYAAVTGSEKPKFYGLIEFPYPSAAGLHVGHPTPSACRRRTLPSRTTSIPPSSPARTFRTSPVS